MSQPSRSGARGATGRKSGLGSEPVWKPEDGNIFEWILLRAETRRRIQEMENKNRPTFGVIRLWR